ncbi:hypothetical protein LIS82_12190 [Cytobacillus solani]|uniref:hypothetical protein n=1 Tax=Cytobacillus solani TaxID=1637975 RepID=UPI00207AE00F|nr:hypothetical protein [Cytobacillus solani]USK57173.1 hypothetical protein LIS82_12190 [Cytobacillus solani]
MEYLTDQDFETAEKNGISKENAYQRFYRYGWSKRRTINAPVKVYTNPWQKWKAIAESNGISERLFRRSVATKWEPEHAAMEPIRIRSKGATQ